VISRQESPTSQEQYEARLARERGFHNKRFGGAEERIGDSFYFAAQPALTEYYRLVWEAAIAKDVLAYGCSKGQSSIEIARVAKHVTGIDISDIAIGQAVEEATRQGITNVTFRVDNAENMTLASESFDLVIGSGILHHLILERCLPQIRRVMRAGGKGIFLEPLGHNLAINLWRRATPEARTIDEHPLLRTDFEIVRKHFSKCNLQFFSLFTLASIPFRTTAAGFAIRAVGEQIDNLLLKLPGVKWHAWIVVMVIEA
jgi:SAM-dependent methyltransferase